MAGLRWRDSKRAPRCESANPIDLAYLRRHGLLRAGSASTLRWTEYGQPTGSVGVLAEFDGIRLCFSIRTDDAPRSPISQLIPFAYTPTRFGGRRQWFACGCGRRCRVIYIGERRFACRHCLGLSYSSQLEPYYQRALDQADRIRRKLGDTTGISLDQDPFPDKPPRMRWMTYRRLKDRYERLEEQAGAGVIMRFEDG